MNIELINTGSELMLGRVLNTHQQWICRQLADLGYVVTRQVAVPDTGPDILNAVREALQRARLIIVTGGLGPTSDDRTRDLIAELLQRPLREDSAIIAHLESFFAQRRRAMPESMRVQAQVPEGGLVLHNAHGTAPGLALEVAPGPTAPAGSLLIMLPGPPRELHPMFKSAVIPLLHEKLPLEQEFVCLTLRTTGLGESTVEEKIDGPLKHLTRAGMDLGFCARVGEVDVRLVATGCGAAQTVREAEGIVRSQINDYIFGINDASLEGSVVERLTAQQQTLALAESCTGGYIAHRITNISGASAVFLLGLVTYSNQAKQSQLGVLESTLQEHGAVSEATAREMAEGARRVSGADYALSVTGIAGPTGGTDTKPVGTVFIGLASAKGTVVRHFTHRFDRETFKYVTAQQALDLLRHAL